MSAWCGQDCTPEEWSVWLSKKPTTSWNTSQHCRTNTKVKTVIYQIIVITNWYQFNTIQKSNQIIWIEFCYLRKFAIIIRKCDIPIVSITIFSWRSSNLRNANKIMEGKMKELHTQGCKFHHKYCHIFIKISKETYQLVLKLTLACLDWTIELIWNNKPTQKISNRKLTILRTVPTIVIAHRFCTSPDTRISYSQCLLIQGYFCMA